MGSFVSLLIDVITSKLLSRSQPSSNHQSLRVTQTSAVEDSSPIESTDDKIDESTNFTNDQKLKEKEREYVGWQTLIGLDPKKYSTCPKIQFDLEPDAYSFINDKKILSSVLEYYINHGAPLYCSIKEDPLKSKSRNFCEFIWKDGAEESVLLAGTFTNWIPCIILVPHDETKKLWRALVDLDLTMGYEYKYVVDGVWRCNLNASIRSDASGITNNIISPVSRPSEPNL